MEWPSWWNTIILEVNVTTLTEATQHNISTGIMELDTVLKGGLNPGCIYEIYGEAGSGKTNLCLEIIKNLSQTYKCYYISTQKPVSLSRLSSLSINFYSVLLL